MRGATARVIILGGGFAGTNAAHALRHAPVRVTAVDRTNHSVFFPCWAVLVSNQRPSAC